MPSFPPRSGKTSEASRSKGTPAPKMAFGGRIDKHQPRPKQTAPRSATLRATTPRSAQQQPPPSPTPSAAVAPSPRLANLRAAAAKLKQCQQAQLHEANGAVKQHHHNNQQQQQQQGVGGILPQSNFGHPSTKAQPPAPAEEESTISSLLSDTDSEYRFLERASDYDDAPASTSLSPQLSYATAHSAAGQPRASPQPPQGGGYSRAPPQAAAPPASHARQPTPSRIPSVLAAQPVQRPAAGRPKSAAKPPALVIPAHSTPSSVMSTPSAAPAKGRAGVAGPGRPKPGAKPASKPATPMTQAAQALAGLPGAAPLQHGRATPPPLSPPCPRVLTNGLPATTASISSEEDRLMQSLERLDAEMLRKGLAKAGLIPGGGAKPPAGANQTPTGGKSKAKVSAADVKAAAASAAAAAKAVRAPTPPPAAKPAHAPAAAKRAAAPHNSPQQMNPGGMPFPMPPGVQLPPHFAAFMAMAADANNVPVESPSPPSKSSVAAQSAAAAAAARAKARTPTPNR